MRLCISLLALSWVIATPLAAETVFIEATGDATLIEHPEGARANGSGQGLFVGRTNQEENGARRALLHFDLSAIPQDVIVEQAILTLNVTSGNGAARELRLHRLLQSWNEGPSISGGGGGAPTQRGDATWLHTFHDRRLWRRPGGHFRMRPSLRRVVEGTGPVSWSGSKALLSDVRVWARAPSKNLGWALIGNESQPGTVKVIAAREHPNARLRPVLEVTYRRAGS